MIVDLKLPDIGNFDSVDVIEIHMNVGDSVAVDETLLTLESDKASMDVPAEKAGVIKEILVSVGDAIAEGAVFAKIEVSEDVAVAKPNVKAEDPKTDAPKAASASLAVEISSTVDADCDVVVIGGGPGGYSAAFRAADLGLKVILVERYSTIGGVCLNVGCIPSKALLHVVDVMESAKSFADIGITYETPKIDIDKLRGFKESVIGKLTGGLAGMAKMRKVEVV